MYNIFCYGQVNELFYTKYFNEVILYEKMKIENMKEHFFV